MTSWPLAIDAAARAVNTLPFATPRAKRAVRRVLGAFHKHGYVLMPTNPSQAIMRELSADASPFLKYKTMLETAQKEMPL